MVQVLGDDEASTWLAQHQLPGTWTEVSPQVRSQLSTTCKIFDYYLIFERYCKDYCTFVFMPHFFYDVNTHN